MRNYRLGLFCFLLASILLLYSYSVQAILPLTTRDTSLNSTSLKMDPLVFLDGKKVACTVQHGEFSRAYISSQLIGKGGNAEICPARIQLRGRSKEKNLYAVDKHYLSQNSSPPDPCDIVSEFSIAKKLATVAPNYFLDPYCLFHEIDPGREDWHFLMARGGESLEKLLAEGKLQKEDKEWLYPQLAYALRIMHQNHVVHGDLSLRNILVTLKSLGAKENSIRIIDFGSSQWVDAGHRAEGKRKRGVVGTSFFVPPEEVLKGRSNSVKKDLFSLGVIFFFIKNGKFPQQVFTPDVSFENIYQVIFYMGKRYAIDWVYYASHIQGGDKLDQLIMEMIDPNYRHRPTIKKAIRHLEKYLMMNAAK